MFPLRDNIPRKTFPFVNLLLIIANVVVFMQEWKLAGVGTLELFIRQYGLVPARFLHAPLAQIPFIFSAMFMHGSWGHLIGNMWFLFIFGDNIEDKVGHVRYFFYYLLMGVGAAMAQVYANPVSHLPMVGASGAIAGILGSYFVLFPGAKVQTLFFIFIFAQVVEIRALFYLGIWFLMQALNSVGSLTAGVRGETGGVAWWAHAGGFLTGLAAIHLFKKKNR